MVTFREIIGHSSIADIPIAHQHNLEELLKKVNLLRTAWGKPLIVSSGYRSMQDHLRIYGQKGITDRSKIPMKSAHLRGDACDLVDSDGSLYAWAFSNQDKLAEWGLYCESGTVGWLHAQQTPPKSGSRFFYP